MLVTFVGDAHAQWKRLKLIIKDHCPHNRVLQVGDMGFFGTRDEMPPTSFPNNFFYIHGNHDNPEVCKTYPSFLGRFGFIKEWNLFYVSGAWSIDKTYRKEGYDWFANEELTMAESYAALDLYEKTKPRYVVTHDGPKYATIPLIKHVILGDNGQPTLLPSRTSQLLSELFVIHRPDIWIFGHHHASLDRTIQDTRFICLGELQTKTLDLNPTL